MINKPQTRRERRFRERIATEANITLDRLLFTFVKGLERYVDPEGQEMTELFIKLDAGWKHFAKRHLKGSLDLFSKEATSILERLKKITDEMPEKPKRRKV